MMISKVYKWLIPITLVVILIPLVIGQRRFPFQRMPSLRDVRTRGILLPARNQNIHSKALIARQGPAAGIASSLLSSGPVILALSSLLFSFPVLPMLFLAPMALSNFLPNMDDNSDPSLNDILQSVQTLGQGILDGIRPITGITSASSAASSSGSTSSSSSTSSSGPSSSSSPTSDSSSSGSVSQSGSSSSNTLGSMGSPSEPIASIVSAPSSSSSSSPSKITSSSSSGDSLADLSTGFLSQLAAINEILSNTNNLSSANTLASLSNLLFSARREEDDDKKSNKYRIPLFPFGSLRKSMRPNPIARSSMDNVVPYFPLHGNGSPRNAVTDRLAALNLKAIWSRSSGVANSLVKRIRDIYSTFRDGLKRYEISESECQARLVCELNQKVIGRSLRNWAKVMTDFIRFDDRLEALGMGGMAKSTLIDLYQAARKGMTDEECSVAYSRCPVTIAVEPVNNSIMGKLFRRNRVKPSAAATQPVDSPPPPLPSSSSSSSSSSTTDKNGNIMITGSHVYKVDRRRAIF
ncbi:probable serine/threonine-protein kinase dyrk2 isoform X2 [Tetranychus urticae]|uniref:probable serine/threonine-protein kinase dyrk2 isoform X2 n=1 Tax=Tetranychus urticae TaxID=32264 RepID=UPI00077B87C9|nr:probable serine/threonine-protein kinase dyrk2 isoform X2 [Tetranychus urticae]